MKDGLLAQSLLVILHYMTFRAKTEWCVVLIAVTLLATGFFAPSISHADTAAVQAQIQQHNDQIGQLQQEIAGYQKQLTSITGQKQTLQSALNTIELNRKKTAAQLAITQNQIAASNLQLSQLGNQIQNKNQSINLDKQTLAESLRTMDSAEDVSIIEQLLASETLADGWVAIDNTAALNKALQVHAQALSTDKSQLTSTQDQVSVKKTELTTLDKDLNTQQGQLDATKKAKSDLLVQTKSKESSYQSLIAQKKAQQKAFESELSALENSLKNVAPGSVPHVGQGILNWPFTTTFAKACLGKAGALGNNFCITQYFGNTPFSTANPQVYNGSGHNAIDIGMPSGTPVLAALGGTVLGTGNTDLVSGCYSFGKWVMVKHANGLDTLYAHLSSINVSKGQAVGTGDTLGYSGMTGYATGPHLHFGVYAGSGVQIMTLQQFRGATTPCANATMPVAPKDAYLNPMSYL